VSAVEVSLMSYVLQRDESKSLVWALGALVNARATSADTGGQFEVLEYTSRAGDAAPIHAHREEAESFYILDGEVTVLLGEEQIKTTAGSFIFISPRQAHAFRVDSPTARFLMLVMPPRLHAFFKEIGEPAPSAILAPPSDEPWDIVALTDASERHGMEVLGPPLEME